MFACWPLSTPEVVSRSQGSVCPFRASVENMEVQNGGLRGRGLAPSVGIKGLILKVTPLHNFKYHILRIGHKNRTSKRMRYSDVVFFVFFFVNT